MRSTGSRGFRTTGTGACKLARIAARAAGHTRRVIISPQAMNRRSILALGLVPLASSQEKKTADAAGYDDTPYLPNQEWRVHDIARPRPQVVRAEPGRPPSDAVILFGKDLSKWVSVNAAKTTDARWKVGNG